MSQTGESETNGPTADIAPRPEPQEGVKLLPSNNSQPQQQYYAQQSPTQQQYQQSTTQHYQPQVQPPNFSGPRPVLRRADSRSSLSYRPTGSGYPSQPPLQPGGVIRPPPQAPVRPPAQPGNYFGPRPQGTPGPRFVPPGVPQQPAPVRYAPYDPSQVQPDGSFRRAVNAVTEGQIRQRPPPPGPRAPGIYPQKSLPGSFVPPMATGGVDPSLKKSFTLDNSDVTTSHSAPDEQNSSNQDGKVQNKNNVDLITSSGIEKQQKYDEIRSSSSLGFNQDSEKDIDTAALNGKSSSREEISDRPESRTGFLSREHSSHSSMKKIDEDDDDAVITPSRAAFASGGMRSGKSTPMSNSSDNVSQKSFDTGDAYKTTKLSSPAHSDSPDIKKSPVSSIPNTMSNSPEIRKPPVIQSSEMKKSPTPPMRTSTENLLKNLDIVRSPSPLPGDSAEQKKYIQDNKPAAARITPEPMQKPATLAPQDKISRSPSPAFVKPPSYPRSESPQIMTPDNDNRKQQTNAKSYDMTPTSPLSNRDSPSMKDDKNIKKLPSPRTESRNIVSGRRTPSGKTRKSEGDNDSGVDESTQGNDRSFNGDQSSPRKTPSKLSKLPSSKCKTPVKMLHSPKSPDPSNSVSASAEKKKVPMNKIQVGAAPSPNIKTVKSKIGSLENTSYKPGGGKIKVENRKIDFSKVQPRIAAKNDTYQPSGGDKKIQQQKLQWNAKSKIGSLENATYKPGGGEKKIESIKLDFKDKAKPKVGSKDNIKHTPGGGDIKSLEEELQDNIETKKLELNVQSKVGSLDNVKHKPGGGDIKIFDDKDYLKQMTSGDQSVLSGSQEYEEYEEYENTSTAFTLKRGSNVRPPTTLNIASASTKRRVRYLDLDGPQSLVDDSPRMKSIDYQRPMSACSNFSRKKTKSKVTFTSITDRPPWRY